MGNNLKGEQGENFVHIFKLQGITIYLYDTKKELIEKENKFTLFFVAIEKMRNTFQVNSWR